MLQLTACLKDLSALINSWPLIAFVVGVSAVCTLALKGLQFRSFFKAWRITLFPSADSTQKEGGINPLQAFLNSLSISIGNGALAGVATAVACGGPGTIFWMVAIGLLLMVVRFAEVYLSVVYKNDRPGQRLGGPIVYIRQLIGGEWLSWIYTLCTLFFVFSMGNAIQANSIAVSLNKGWAISPLVVAGIFLVFNLYTLLGGAKRILRISDAIVPVKVLLFFSTSLIIVVYHWQQLLPALSLIIKAAFTPEAIAGGAIGYTVKEAMRFGIFRSIFATEAGLGTAGILFGATESKRPMEDGLMAMLSTFISTLVCLLVGLCIVMSGAYLSGETSTALTTAAYTTVFGWLGSWLVTALAISFGVGVQVAYAFVAREIWCYIFGDRTVMLFNAAFCAAAFFGAYADAHILWYFGDVVNAGMLVINLLAILALLGVVRKGMQAYEQRS